ncbi:MAG: thioredoxin-disulfide reductase [Clostridiales bacterium]|nr:MAG: thioredoxin-disulfide reductase [Clostridiales bacterium]
MIYDLMIIGGGPAGLSAGLYAARARLSAAVLTDGGGQVTSTSEIENYLGIENIDGFELDRLFTEHAVKMGAKIIRGRAEALSDGGEIKTIKTRDGELSARAVILAMGATHRELGLESERRLFGSGVSYCATCDGAFFRGKTVAVVGGGDTALADALYLSNIASHVYLIHRRDAFRASPFLVERAESKGNIRFIMSTVVEEIYGEDRVKGLKLKNVSNGNIGMIDADGVFVAVGIKPNSVIAEGIVGLDGSGFIKAGEDCRTDRAGFFAAGDIRTKPLRQIICAVSDGAVAVESALEYLNRK